MSRFRNRGHRLIARWGEEILLETSGNQRTWSSISGWKQWQWQRDQMETADQSSLMGNVISWDLGPLHLSTARIVRHIVCLSEVANNVLHVMITCTMVVFTMILLYCKHGGANRGSCAKLHVRKHRLYGYMSNT